MSMPSEVAIDPAGSVLSLMPMHYVGGEANYLWLNDAVLLVNSCATTGNCSTYNYEQKKNTKRTQYAKDFTADIHKTINTLKTSTFFHRKYQQNIATVLNAK